MDNVNEIDRKESYDDLIVEKTSSTLVPPMALSSRAKIKSSIQDFLEEESRALPTEASGVKYDLVEEYSATKANALKNLVPVLLWMFAAVLFVGVMAGAIVTIVSRQNSKITVEVESFDNLNLSNLLDLVSSTQSQINEESAVKAGLESRRKAILEQAESERSSALATLDSMNLKDASEIRKRRNEIQAEYDASVSQIAEIDAQIAESEQKINLYQQQLAQYDTATVQQAQEHQAEMDSEKRLHQLEKQRMSSEYEGKISGLQADLENQQQEAMKKQKETVDFVIGQYDPTFSDDGSVLSVVKKASAYAPYYTGSREALDETASEEFKAALKKQQSYFNDISVVSSRFLRIPQKNAIPSFASAMQKIANSAGNELAAASVAEINKLLGQNHELSDKNQALETEKTEMTAQIEGLEGEKESLLTQNGTLTEEKNELETKNAALASEKETLAATNAELSGANESLSAEKSSLTSELSALTKEKEGWDSLRESMESSWASEKAAMEQSWASEKASLIAERDEASAAASKAVAGDMDSLAAEKNALASANAELSAQSEKLRADYKKLEDENKALASERDSLAEKNKNLSSAGNQYNDLMQAFCTKDGKKIHGIVSGKVNARRMQLYIEKSVYSGYVSKAGDGSLVPVSVVRNGKVIACGKLSVDGGTVYMIKGSEEDQIMVESLVTLSGSNDYSQVVLGDEIQISDPL